MRHALFVLVLALLAPLALGQTTILYVDSNAPSGGDGSQSRPYDGIDDVNTVLAASAGRRIIRLRAGSTFTTGLNIVSNTRVEKWGTGADPVITETSDECIEGANLRDVWIENVDLDTGTYGFHITSGYAENVVLYRVDAYDQTITGFIHDDANTAVGTVTYIECTAARCAADGFSNRGRAYSIAIRCSATDISAAAGGGAGDGFTSHNVSRWDLFYCTMTRCRDGAHIKPDDGTASGVAMTRIIGCTFQTCGNGIYTDTGLTPDTIVEGCTFIECGEAMEFRLSISTGGTFTVDDCAFIRCWGVDVEDAAADSGAIRFVGRNASDDLIVQNCRFIIPNDWTDAVDEDGNALATDTVYGIRMFTSGELFVYNCSFVCGSTVEPTYFVRNAGGALTMRNCAMDSADDADVYYARVTNQTSGMGVIDNNWYGARTTNTSAWYNENGASGVSFATWQGYNKGVSAASTDGSGGTTSFALFAADETSQDADVDGLFVLDASEAYGVGANLSATFRTAHGRSFRQGGSAAWNVGPSALSYTEEGYWISGNETAVFADYGLDDRGRWDIPLRDGTIMGTMRGAIRVDSVSLTSDATGTWIIHEGRGTSRRPLFAGAIAGASVAQPTSMPMAEGSAGQDLYISFPTGTGNVFGSVSTSTVATSDRNRVKRRR